MRLSREARTHREEIEEAIQCSADDKGIAKYYHIPLFEVQALRFALQIRAEREREDANRLSDEEAGCVELRTRLHLYFRRWERKHGFKEGAGELLVPAGYQPRPFMLNDAA